MTAAASAILAVVEQHGFELGPKLFKALYAKAREGRRTRCQLPGALFSTVVADPNWGYEQFGQAKHGAQRAHYQSSAVETLGQIPVWEWASPSSNLFCWATGPKFEGAIDVIRAWGWHVVTTIPWVKTVNAAGTIKRGIGHWGYSAAEYLLVCRRGTAKSPKYRSGSDKPYMLLAGPRENPCFYDTSLHEWLSDPDLTNEIAPVFYAKLGPHSRKPLSLFEWIESYFPGRYLELFARDTRVGWTTLGHRTGWHLSAEGPIPFTEAVERGLAVADAA